ncbi:MAG: response regulator [Deltaproteobacteria bacterium]|nr:response regulator [Deltaproteobacteria bacterium]
MDDKSSQVRAAVAQLWERSRGTMLSRVAVLEQATLALLAGVLDAAGRQHAEREAHKLSGSLGTFGFARGSRLAREMEHLFQGGAPLGQAEASHLSELVGTLRQDLAGPAPAPPTAPVPEDKRPRLLVISAEVQLAEQLAAEAQARGLRTESVTTLATARDIIAHAPPTVAVLDLSFAESPDTGLSLLSELAERTPSLPTLVLTASNAFVDRVEVARRGGSGFLQRPLPPAQILDAVCQCLGRLRAAETSVLAVDDDPHVLALLQALLQPQGIRVTTLSDPLRFWEVLQETSPDLLMLDVDMPSLNGIELCRVVRNDPRWAEMPVLFLTAHTESDTIHQVFAAGADDFVGKPIVGPELITRITNRLERTRLLRTLAETDALTGVANRRKSTQVLEHFLSLASRRSQAFCLAVVDIDHFKRVNDQHGHATVDAVLRRLGEVLQRSFRGEDIVARWGGEEFLVGMYGMSRDDGVQRIADLLEAWRQEEFDGPANERFHITFSAGVAEYPTDGGDLQSLYRAADRALYQAKAAGRDRVLPAGWHAEQSQAEPQADVVLVDDDETLAAVLLQAMETRGHRTRWLRDGQEAVAALGGATPRLKTRMLLLNVDLPGLDGLSVLRCLAQDDVARHTRVIMLTGHTAETEVATALELGAFDYVAKPCSLPVLLQRVRRALQG